MDEFKINNPADQAVAAGAMPHPGEWIRANVLKPYGLNVAETARRIGVDRATLNRVLLGEHAVSDDLAYKLEALTGVAAELMIAMQRAHDLPKVQAKRAKFAKEIGRVSLAAEA